MKNIIRLAAAIFALIIAGVSYGQIGQAAPLPQVDKSEISGPTLEETQDWLTTKVRSLGVYRLDYDAIRTEVYFSGCTMYVLHVKTAVSSAPYYRYTIAVVDMENLDLENPSFSAGSRPIFSAYYDTNNFDLKIQADQRMLAAFFNGDVSAAKTIVSERMRNTNSSNTKYSSLVFSYDPNNDLHLRVQNALRQATRHCIKIAQSKAANTRVPGARPPGEKF